MFLLDSNIISFWGVISWNLWVTPGFGSVLSTPWLPNLLPRFWCGGGRTCFPFSKALMVLLKVMMFGVNSWDSLQNKWMSGTTSNEIGMMFVHERAAQSLFSRVALALHQTPTTFSKLSSWTIFGDVVSWPQHFHSELVRWQGCPTEPIGGLKGFPLSWW